MDQQTWIYNLIFFMLLWLGYFFGTAENFPMQIVITAIALYVFFVFGLGLLDSGTLITEEGLGL